jgi:hypothetical protein
MNVNGLFKAYEEQYRDFVNKFLNGNHGYILKDESGSCSCSYPGASACFSTDCKVEKIRRQRFVNTYTIVEEIWADDVYSAGVFARTRQLAIDFGNLEYVIHETKEYEEVQCEY